MNTYGVAVMARKKGKPKVGQLSLLPDVPEVRQLAAKKRRDKVRAINLDAATMMALRTIERAGDDGLTAYEVRQNTGLRENTVALMLENLEKSGHIKHQGTVWVTS